MVFNEEAEKGKDLGGQVFKGILLMILGIFVFLLIVGIYNTYLFPELFSVIKQLIASGVVGNSTLVQANVVYNLYNSVIPNVNYVTIFLLVLLVYELVIITLTSQKMSDKSLVIVVLVFSFFYFIFMIPYQRLINYITNDMIIAGFGANNVGVITVWVVNHIGEVFFFYLILAILLNKTIGGLYYQPQEEQVDTGLEDTSLSDEGGFSMEE